MLNIIINDVKFYIGNIFTNIAKTENLMIPVKTEVGLNHIFILLFLPEGVLHKWCHLK